MATRSTAITLDTSWMASGQLGPPLSVNCRRGGKEVSVRGVLGPERVDIQLQGLRPGKNYTFTQFEEPPPRATVTVTESGPVLEAYFVNPTTGEVTARKPPRDSLAPHQGMEDQGNGKLSVSQSGRTGSLRVMLPQGDSISGHWACGTKQRTGPTSRPALSPATVPPSVNECALGTIQGPPPPVSCRNGDFDVNAWEFNAWEVDAWESGAALSTALSTAGRSVSLTKVEAELCSDYEALLASDAAPTSVSMARDYSIAARYYGWTFPSTPAQVVTDAGCVS
ncbi:MAG: hypothetical protein ACREN1_01940 [Candidatus Dormibacteria bacterium]